MLDRGRHRSGGVLDPVARRPAPSVDCSENQQTMASMSWPTSGRLWGRQIMSPRLTSMSSVSCMVTDWGGNASVQRRTAGAADLGDPGGEARRQHDDLVAGLEDAAGHRAGVAAVVVQVVVGAALRPDHVLHREAGVDEVAVRGDVDLLEVVQQRRALVPGHVVAAARRRCRRAGPTPG